MKETKNLEFKQEITNSFLKTVSAFANFGTGQIKFGITDNGTLCGINNPDQNCLNIENKINDSISPKPDYSLEINKKTNVITLTVKEGVSKPYLYNGKAYRRSDTATIEVDNIELKRLTLEGSNVSFEELPTQDTNLSFKYLENKMINTMGITKLTNDMLKSIDFYTKDNRLNNAAALFADHNSFFGIDTVRFGKTINEINERETYSNMSILQQYDNIITFYKRYYQYESINSIERKTIETVPELAFREAIANALVHRTWDVNSHIKVEMYSDRIEIISPGGLPRQISEKEYLYGNVSQLRNRIIGNMFYRLHYIEQFGTGIRRITNSYSKSNNKPLFEIFDNSIKIILPVLNNDTNITPDEKTVVDILNNNLLLSSTDIATAANFSKDKTIRILNKLKMTGIVQAVGNGRGTRYKIS